MSYNLPEDGDKLRWKMKKCEDEIWIVKPPGFFSKIGCLKFGRSNLQVFLQDCFFLILIVEPLGFMQDWLFKSGLSNLNFFLQDWLFY